MDWERSRTNITVGWARVSSVLPAVHPTTVLSRFWVSSGVRAPQRTERKEKTKTSVPTGQGRARIVGSPTLEAALGGFRLSGGHDYPLELVTCRSDRQAPKISLRVFEGTNRWWSMDRRRLAQA